MMPEDLRLAFDIFDQVCDLPSGERGAVLDERCAGKPLVRARVERMLAKDASADEPSNIMQRGAGVDLLATVTEPSADMPQTIGAYRIIRELGRGGMGVVYEAEQENPKRTVALKVLREIIAGRQAYKRFQREADLLARLQHPGVAQVYEAGVAQVQTRSGRGYEVSYFAMELIRGEPLDDYAQSHSLDRNARLDLFARICDAVQHAHDQSVIHRDLKPDNILVNERGEPKVLDFGIARITDSDVQTLTMKTEVGQLIGTLAYMSPEQLAGDPDAIDERTDIYSLGVVLYQLMADTLPFGLRGKPIAEIARIVQHEDPTHLSSIDKTLRGDVETIVAKAMEKERERRYQSPAELGEDVRRYLGDVPIVARPASTVYQLRKFARRNKALVGGVAATFVVLVLGVIGTGLGLVSALDANSSLERTNLELEQANTNLESIAEFQSSQLGDIDVALMGGRMREGLLTAVGKDRRAALEAELAGINFADEARNTLRENIFERSIEAIDSQFADQPLVRARLLQTVATTLHEIGLFEFAVDPQRRVVEIRRETLGDGHVSTIEALTQLASLLAVSDDLSGSESAYLEALAQTRQLLGDDDERTLSALSGLGSTLFQQARYEEAEEVLREALEGQRRVLGDDHPDTILTKSGLGILLDTLGDYQASEALLREVMEARRSALGADHRDTLSAAANLASALNAQGKLDESARLWKQTLDHRRRLLGNDHPDTLSSINSYAMILDQMGRYAEAEPLYRESLAGHRRMLGSDHAMTLMAAGNLGFILNLQGKAPEAVPLFRESLAGLRLTLGDDHPSTLTAVGNLAALLLGIGKADEAEPLYLESLEGRRSLFGDDHVSTLNAVFNMGNMLMLTGKLDEAEPFCVESVESHRRVLGADHVGTQYSLVNLGQLRMAQGRHAEAEAFFREALESRARVLGEDHPQSKIAREHLVAAIDAQGAGAE